jgi:hypothetical protein
MTSNHDLLNGLRAHHFTGGVAIVARDDFDDGALKDFGATTILYPMRNAVDYAVDALTALIHPNDRATPEVESTASRSQTD